MHHPGDTITGAATQGATGGSPLTWFVVLMGIVFFGFIIYLIIKSKKG